MSRKGQTVPMGTIDEGNGEHAEDNCWEEMTISKLGKIAAKPEKSI